MSLLYGFRRIAIFCIISCYSIGFLLADDYSIPQTIAKPVSNGNLIVLKIAKSIQKVSGIQTQALELNKNSVEYLAYGKVLNPEPLIQFRAKYLTVRAQYESFNARLNESQQNLSRIEVLHHQGIVSTQRLQEQQFRWSVNNSKVDENIYLLQNILSRNRLVWGESLTSLFIEKDKKIVERFLKRNVCLLQITMPVNSSINRDLNQVYIDERDQRQRAILVEMISKSPVIDSVTQGHNYFFISEGRTIPFDSRVTAWVTTNSQSKAVEIPKTAVVWYLGQAYVFIKTSEEEFVRRAVPDLINSAHGYFSGGSLKIGEDIVTVGAQALLSESLKYKIPSLEKD